MLRFAYWILRTVAMPTMARAPDKIIGSTDDPYMHRWFLIPRNRLFNIYIHRFHRSDDDRALHDHPWFWCSLLLQGCYTEHTIAAGGIHKRRFFDTGALRFGTPWKTHRIELKPGTHTTTLFITGPRLRDWGFHCLHGWVHFKTFEQRGCD